MKISFRSAFLVFSVISSSGAYASGYDLVYSYGTRYIGLGGTQVSVAKDAYAPFYNPAGMMAVQGTDVVATTSNLFLQSEAPIGADNAQKKGQWDWGQLFYIGGVYRFHDRIAFGLAVYPTALQGASFSNVNFGGLGSKDKSVRMSRIEIAPSIAFKLVDHLYLGASIRPGYTRLDQQDGIPGLFHSEQTVSSWGGVAAKVGAMLDDIQGFSAALTFRPKIETTLKGESHVNYPIGAVTTHAEKDIEIPAQLQAGISYEWLKDRLLSAFTYEYTHNDVIEYDTTRLTGLQSKVAQIDALASTNYAPLFAGDVAAVPLHYRNGHTFHIGTEYTCHFNAGKKLRTGLGFAMDRAFTSQKTPNPLVPPPTHYYGYAIGTQYQFGTHAIGVSFNYGHYEKTLNNVDKIATAGQIYNGKYALTAYLISADYKVNF